MSKASSKVSHLVDLRSFSPSREVRNAIPCFSGSGSVSGSLSLRSLSLHSISEEPFSPSCLRFFDRRSLLGGSLGFSLNERLRSRAPLMGRSGACFSVPSSSHSTCLHGNGAFFSGSRLSFLSATSARLLTAAGGGFGAHLSRGWLLLLLSSSLMTSVSSWSFPALCHWRFEDAAEGREREEEPSAESELASEDQLEGSEALKSEEEVEEEVEDDEEGRGLLMFVKRSASEQYLSARGLLGWLCWRMARATSEQRCSPGSICSRVSSALKISPWEMAYIPTSPLSVYLAIRGSRGYLLPTMLATTPLPIPHPVAFMYIGMMATLSSSFSSTPLICVAVAANTPRYTILAGTALEDSFSISKPTHTLSFWRKESCAGSPHAGSNCIRLAPQWQSCPKPACQLWTLTSARFGEEQTKKYTSRSSRNFSFFS